jgi:SAM-dependent methyltransferase
MSGAYIHGTEPSEQQRLAALNRITNSEFVTFRDVKPGMRVLDVGSGLGLLAAQVAAATANIQVVGVERASAQISAAVTALFVEAGLSKMELSVQPEVHWHGSEGFAAWIQNLIGNIESARRGLIESTLCINTQLDNAVAELTRLLQDRTASAAFIWNRAKGVNQI